MNRFLLKNFNFFTATVAVFLISAVYCGYVYMSCNSPLEPVPGKDAVNVEVSMPVLEWTKYVELSKKLNISANIKIRRVVGDMSEESALRPYR